MALQSELGIYTKRINCSYRGSFISFIINGTTVIKHTVNSNARSFIQELVMDESLKVGKER